MCGVLPESVQPEPFAREAMVRASTQPGDCGSGLGVSFCWERGDLGAGKVNSSEHSVRKLIK